MQLLTKYHNSPLGVLKIQATPETITSIHFTEEIIGDSETSDLLELCARQLDEYFSGSRKTFDFPMEQKGTPFQISVWSHLLKVPYGKTLSYLSFSKGIGDVKAIRAVASANGKNNLSIVVPCHRIIGSGATMVGYSGGIWRKKWLLEHEAKTEHGIMQSSLFANS
ncbi:MAG TPA: methylated-DNA--[protein]-cysteine S-methyltransferase [Chitinophagaceae bacterium]|jgi:methylated-DNA-[protein]-cysteine S-methyltransferase|nr:methylated-DNA--[protein]-cysteine S-methyltransferase [Chitinophagaceae bacterium]